MRQAAQRQASKSRAPKHRRGLALEALEARQLYSVTPDNVPRSLHSPIDTIRTPQFVSLGWDDNTEPLGIDWVVKTFGDRADAKGGPITTSFYMNSVGFGPSTPSTPEVPPGDGEGAGLLLGADPAALVTAFKSIVAAGHEVGNHTFDHHAQVLVDKGGWNGMVQYLSNQATVAEWTTFLVQCNAALQNPGGMDLSKVTGYRSPFLEYGKHLFPALSQLGFTYECSIEAISDDDKNFPFPYTLDAGSPDHAAGAKADPKNPDSFEVPATPGLWEVPAYALRIPDAVEEKAYGLSDVAAKLRAGWASIGPADVHVTGFDYNVFLGKVDAQGKKTGPALTGAEVLGLLKYNLDIRLAGNRAPFCFGTHSQYYLESWVAENAPHVTVAEMRKTITDFLDYARSKPEVRIVSGQQIVDWMRNPVPLDDRVEIQAPQSAPGVVAVNTPRITLGNLYSGYTTEVKVNDGPWTRLVVDASNGAALPPLRQGMNTAVFRQYGADGTSSTLQPVRINFDTTPPARPLVALRQGRAEGLTNDPTLRVARVDTDARVQYSVNGAPFSDVYAPADGPTVVRIRCVDEAGNVSRPSAPVRFRLDRAAAAPAVALQSDTGVPGDRITTDGRLVVTGTEPGARIQYSSDEGRTWKPRFQATFGRNDVLVRQRDRAGNHSDATAFSFTRVFASGTLDLTQVLVMVVNETPAHFANSGKVGVMRQGEQWNQGWYVIEPDRTGRGSSLMVPLSRRVDTTEGDLRQSFVFLVGPQLDLESVSPENFGLIQFAAGIRSDGTFVLREKYKGTGDMTVGQTKVFDYDGPDERFRIRFERLQWAGGTKPVVTLRVQGFYPA